MIRPTRGAVAAALALSMPLALAGFPGAGGAQDTTERATFHIVSHAVGGTDTVVSERSARGAARLDGEIVASSGGRTTYTAMLSPEGLVTRLEIRAFRGPAFRLPHRPHPHRLAVVD